jgi:4-hydroxy-tetrahydrodipicolinate synthase
LFELLAVETNPIPVKWALQEMSLCSARLRLPLVALSERHRAALRDALESLDLLRP